MDARRIGLVGLALLAGALAVGGQDEPAPKLAKRYGYNYEAGLFPQKTPQETMQSILKALDGKKLDYLLAHLADPKFVDDRVIEYMAFQKGNEAARAILGFERLARETEAHFREDPPLVRELRQFAKEADWEEKEGTATGSLKSGSPRRVYMKKLEDRWFLENKQQ